MQFPFLNNNFSDQVDFFSDDGFSPGNLPGLSSFTNLGDIGDIVDDVLGDEFDVDGPPGARKGKQRGLFGEEFMNGDFSSIWSMVEEYFTPLLEWISSVMPSGGGSQNFEELDLGFDILPSEGKGKRKQTNFPESSVPALYAYSEGPPPGSSAPSSSIALVSTPETSLPVSSVPVISSYSDSSPFDTTPQVGPLTPEEGRAMAVKVARQLMIDFPGMTKEQAAGIVGNLWHESAGMNANVNEFGSSPPDKTYGPPNETQFGYGWAQWTGSRKWDYINFCERQGLDPRSPAANYAFLKHELKNGEADGTPSSLPYIFAANTVDESAYAFRYKYERATMPLDSERYKYARELYGLL